MKTLRLVAPTLLVVLGWLSFCLAQSSSSKVQGVAPQGTTPVASVNPVVIGGANGTTVKTIQTDPSGNLTFTGTAVEDSTTTGQPFVMAGKDNGGLTRVANVTPGGNSLAASSRALAVGFRDGAGNMAIAVVETTTNAQHVTEGINSVLDTVTPSYRIVSNGVNTATIFTGVASKRWVIAKFTAKNTSASITHTVNFFDQTGAFWSVSLGPGQAYADDTRGFVVIGGGASFTFAIDGSGSATDVEVYATGVNK